MENKVIERVRTTSMAKESTRVLSKMKMMMNHPQDVAQLFASNCVFLSNSVQFKNKFIAIWCSVDKC